MLAAVAGTAAAGIAALARAGLCLHQLGLFGQRPAPMAGMTMGGMAMDTTVTAPCPILLGTAAAAAALCVAALIAVLVLRPRASALAVDSARLVLGARLGPTTALLAAIGAVPLWATLACDGATVGIAPYVAALTLLVCAAVTAGVLTGIAKLILAFARRLVTALLASPRWLLPGSEAPWLGRTALVPIPAGTRLVRRRPSRAPPHR
ncbi:MAG TPA: hypothetical protein VFE70_08745 [Candidatus Elarobacter sp.]|nr:hypothetical protein [Candidatus Elarobacter sp.]